MVEIKLIKFTNGIATVLCYPEGESINQFTLVLDIVNKTILKNSLNKKNNPYAVHAAWKMYDEYEKTQDLPNITSVAWC